MTEPIPPNGRGLARRRHHLVRLALLTLGWGLLVTGLLGGLIPFVQGWPFGVAGAVILYVESRWFQRKVRRWRQRHPRVERVWLKLRSWRHGRKKPRPNGPRPGSPPDDAD